MSKYRRLVLYSAEKRYHSGDGNYCKTLTVDNFDDIDEHIRNLRAEQKQKNKEFKEKLKRGEVLARLGGTGRTSGISGIGRTRIGITDSNTGSGSDLPRVDYKNSITLKLSPKTGNTTFLLGSSKMGKTTLLMHLYEKYYSGDRFISILFSINSQIKEYRKRKNLLKCPEFNNKAQKLVRMEKFINTKCKNKYNFANLFDDVIDVRFSKLINDLILTYRNSKISSLISLQYSNLLSKCARSNVNNVICFGFNTDESIRLVLNTFLKSYFSKLGLRSEPEMINFYKEVTKDHGFIYIHPASGSISFHRIPLEKLQKRK